MNSAFEEVDNVQGFSKFYLYVDKSSKFKVKSGGHGAEEKVTITVNTGGDEAIDEILDTVVFDNDSITDQGTTEITSKDGIDGTNPDAEEDKESDDPSSEVETSNEDDAKTDDSELNPDQTEGIEDDKTDVETNGDATDETEPTDE